MINNKIFHVNYSMKMYGFLNNAKLSEPLNIKRWVADISQNNSKTNCLRIRVGHIHFPRHGIDCLASIRRGMLT